MKPLGHLVLSAGIAGGSYAATGSLPIAVSTFSIGVLMDGDHLFDYAYYLFHTKKRIRQARLKQFFNSSYMEETGRVFLPLHSYELLIPIWLVCAVFSSIPLAIWLTVSFTVHLTADLLAYRPLFLTYSFTVRAMNRFRRDALSRTDPEIHGQDESPTSHVTEYTGRPYNLRPPTDTVKDNVIHQLIKSTGFRGRKLVDLGCGMGHLCSRLSSLIDVVGVDISTEGVRIASQKSGGAFIHGDAQLLAFKDNSFDYVIAKDVLEHVPDDKKVLSEIFRVSKNNAQVILYLPGKLDGLNLSVESIVKKLTGYTLDPEVGHLRRYEVATTLQLLRTQGLRPQKVWYMVHFALGIAALLTVKGFHILKQRGKTNLIFNSIPRLIVKTGFHIFKFFGQLEAATLKNVPGAGFFVVAEVEKESASPGNDRLPLVSVIVPTRNSARTIQICLASIKHQTYPNIELIVVDNNSTDETKEIARRYTDLVFNKGPERNVQRSYAASQADGEYLAFIDSDMELSPGIVESAVNKCERGNYDAVILPEISIGEGFWANCRKLEKLCYLSDQSMELANRFMKTTVFQDVGGYDCNQDWIGAEDFDIHERLKDKGCRIGRTDELIKHHEVVPFKEMLKKYYTYGKYIPKHVNRHPLTGIRQFSLVRPAYIRNWQLFVKDPLHGLGLAFMKSVQYFVGGLGFIVSLFQKKSYNNETVASTETMG